MYAVWLEIYAWYKEWFQFFLIVSISIDLQYLKNCEVVLLMNIGLLQEAHTRKEIHILLAKA